ncbi:hypothetical protein PS25CTX_1440 (plasmid) [Escherichia coli]
MPLICEMRFYDEYLWEDSTHRTDLSGKCSYIVVIRPKTTLVAQGYFQYLDTKLN